MGMWIVYQDAYCGKELEQTANVHIEEIKARMRMIVDTEDEA